MGQDGFFVNFVPLRFKDMIAFPITHENFNVLLNLLFSFLFIPDIEF